MAATPEEQGATECVLALVADVGVKDQFFELCAIVMEFALVELILQEFRDNLGFV
jgi:hypothetical protein